VAKIAVDRVRDLVAEHEMYWTRVAQHDPSSHAMRWFLTTQWDPLYAQWIDLLVNHGLSDDDVDLLVEFVLRINGLRGVAQAHGIPVPHPAWGTAVPT
jgi:hypothetical protein